LFLHGLDTVSRAWYTKSEDRKVFKAASRCVPGTPESKAIIDNSFYSESLRSGRCKRMAVVVAGGPLEERFNRGLRYKINGQYEEAVNEFLAVLASDPLHAQAHMHLGLVYGFIGCFDESIEELRKAVELAPHCIEARVNLAKTYCMLGMDKEAIQEFQRVLEEDPNNEEASKQLRFLTSAE
jgi:tetratricopeptide (TPR) repeat protein